MMVKSMKENLDFTQKRKGFTFILPNDLVARNQKKLNFELGPYLVCIDCYI